MARIADVKNKKKRTKSVLLDELSFKLFKNRKLANSDWNFSQYVCSCLKRDFPELMDEESVYLQRLIDAQNERDRSIAFLDERVKEAADELAKRIAKKEKQKQKSEEVVECE